MQPLIRKNPEGSTQWTFLDERPLWDDREIFILRSWPLDRGSVEAFLDDRILIVLAESLEVIFEDNKLRHLICKAGQQIVVPGKTALRFRPEQGCLMANFPRRPCIAKIDVSLHEKKGHMRKWLFKNFGRGNEEAAAFLWNEGGQSDPHGHGGPEITWVLDGELREHYWDKDVSCEAIYIAGKEFLVHPEREHVIQARLRSLSVIHYPEGPVPPIPLREFKMPKALLALAS